MLKVTKDGHLITEPDKPPKLPKVPSMKEMGVKLSPPPKKEKAAAPAKKVPRDQVIKIAKPSVPDIPIPAKLTKQPAAQSVASGAYAKKIMAHCAPVLLPAMVNSLHRKIQADDMSANKLAAEIYRLMPTKAPLVNVTQTNDNRTATVNNDNRSGEFGTADEMFRLLAADREKRALGPAPREFEVLKISSSEKIAE